MTTVGARPGLSSVLARLILVVLVALSGIFCGVSAHQSIPDLLVSAVLGGVALVEILEAYAYRCSEVACREAAARLVEHTIGGAARRAEEALARGDQEALGDALREISAAARPSPLCREVG